MPLQSVSLKYVFYVKLKLSTFRVNLRSTRNGLGVAVCITLSAQPTVNTLDCFGHNWSSRKPILYTVAI